MKEDEAKIKGKPRNTECIYRVKEQWVQTGRGEI